MFYPHKYILKRKSIISVSMIILLLIVDKDQSV